MSEISPFFSAVSKDWFGGRDAAWDGGLTAGPESCISVHSVEPCRYGRVQILGAYPIIKLNIMDSFLYQIRILIKT